MFQARSNPDLRSLHSLYSKQHLFEVHQTLKVRPFFKLEFKSFSSYLLCYNSTVISLSSLLHRLRKIEHSQTALI